MTVVKLRPTSSGVRHKIVTKYNYLYKGKSLKSLLSMKEAGPGRNNGGSITVRHKGGRRRVQYRNVDFLRNKIGINGVVERIEYDPNRTAHIALVKYADGDRQYIVAQETLREGSVIVDGTSGNYSEGNSLKLRDISLGATISCLELHPGSGAKVARSAGSFCKLMAKDDVYATVKLKSGEVRKFKLDCKASLGVVSNGEHMLTSYGKAGAKRWMGIRPTVRGVAMNPVDHPHGGGEGKTSTGRHPVTPWGKLTKGKKTRKKSKVNNLIVSFR